MLSVDPHRSADKDVTGPVATASESPFHSAASAGQYLGDRLGAPATVRFSRARTAPVRASREADGTWNLRLHRFFATAPEGICEDLSAWLRSGRRARRACERLDEWIDQALAQLPPAIPRALSLSPLGTVHDLTPMAQALLRGPFDGEFCEVPPPAVTWGRRGRSRAHHTLRLGTYVPSDHLVRVHPALDQTWVPAWFVNFILHHELLHAALDQGRTPAGQRIHHGPAFRAREGAHPDFARAVTWEKKNLGRLIRSARAGTGQGAPASKRQGSALRHLTQTLLLPFH